MNLAFVDVPGHERFVRNMLAGAGGIDLVMLVVAADESVMPQTREHFHICRLLEVPAGIIVLTKSDAADSEMVELAGLEVRELVAGSFLERRTDGCGVVENRRRSGRAARRAGVGRRPSSRTRRVDGAARLPIDRVFSVKGFGTVVTGTLVSGRIRQDDELTLLPAGLAVKARGVQVHGRDEGVADAGRRVAVNVGGVELTQVTRGDTLCTPGAFESTRRVDVRIDLLRDARALRHAARIRFHQGTTEVLGRVALAAALEPGGSGYARIRFEGPAVLTRGDRFILRAYSPAVTIGGGIVLDPHPPRSPIRNTAAAARFARLDAAGTAPVRDDSAVLSFVEERRAAGLADRGAGEPGGPGNRRCPCCRAEACDRRERLASRARSGVARGSAGSRRTTWSRCSPPTTRRSHCRKGCRARKCASACSGTPRLRCSTRWSRRLQAPAGSWPARGSPWPGISCR